MNTIEDRLRAATQAAADTVADFSQPPLRLPARAPGYGRPGTRIAAPRLIASVATATAIVAVAAIVVVARGVTAGHQPAGAEGAGSIPAGVPPIYVATIATKKGLAQSGRANEAAIVRTSTGKVLATVAVPRPFNAFGEVSASADDRVFVLAAEKFPRPSRGWVANDGPTRLYLLRFDPGAERSITLTALKIRIPRDDNFPVGIALSPSGTHLAVDSEEAGVGHPAKLQVYDLTNGTFRVWSLPNSQTTASPAISSPSWVGGDRFLAALVYAKTPARCKVGCVELLDTRHVDSSITTASKTIFATESLHKVAAWDSVLVNAGGSRLILAGLTGKRQKNGVSLYGTAVLYNITVPSGHVVSHLRDKTGNNFLPLWAGAKAGLMIIGRPHGDNAISAAVYSQHQRIPLHLPANTLGAAW